MPRLPVPGADDDNWGAILNEYLLVSHHPDGSKKGRTQFEIEEFYLASDGDDWSKAYRRALEYWVDYSSNFGFVGDSRGFTLRFMAKEYTFSGSLDVVRGMHLEGSGGFGFPGGTRLIFPYGVDGIIVHHVIRLQTPGRDPNDITLSGHDLEIFNRGLALSNLVTPNGLVDMRGTGVVIERMSLHALAAPNGAAEHEAHGIAVRSTCVLRDLYINNFSGNGIDIRAWVPTWNANAWQVQNCFIGNCQDGFYCWGSDVNAGCAIGISCTNNRGWGIWDASFLGNTYIACHSDSNSEGAYRTGAARDGSLRSNSSNVFLGCYGEGNVWPGGRVVMKAPTIVIGGTIGPIQHWRDMGISDAQMASDPAAKALFEEFRSTATMLFTKGYGGSFPNGGVTGTSAPNHDLSPQLGMAHAYARLGSDVFVNAALEFGWEQDESPKPDVYRLKYEFTDDTNTTGWWSLRAGEGDEIGPPLRVSTDIATEKRGQIWFQNGFFVGGGNAQWAESETRPRLRIVTGNEPPAQGQWKVGDRVLNATPLAGGWSGWICIAERTPGNWKGFGKIES